ncbi:DUF4037 domain-containing protein [Streptomyces sp. NPDC091377]|uniref:DUF4037 domain-containing protein n=1 Tax=Streptomyces sp. NPDC091377 TaxID=3365995 RepID=UPI0037FB8F70
MRTKAVAPALELARRHYAVSVRPLLERALPGTPHSAARLAPADGGPGSPEEPLLLLLLPTPDAVARTDRLFAHRPQTAAPGHAGWDITDPDTWFTRHLGFDPHQGVTLAHWLTTPTAALAEVTGSDVLHDGLDRLTLARTALAWYPHDLWLHMLARQWQRIAREEALAARCAEAGDTLGADVAVGRTVRELMRLGLLMDRRYPPHEHRLGAAFARTPYAPVLLPRLAATLAATDRHIQESWLARTYETVARAHDALGVTAPLSAARDRRPERFTAALVARVTDPEIRALPLTGTPQPYAGPLRRSR